MEKKEQLKKELLEIEEAEEKEREDTRKQQNYERFLERDEDYMIGRAHADVSFIGERYWSDKQKPLIPVSVSVSGNSGTTYYPKALLTSASKTYFHNVWENADREGFQQRFNDFVQKEIEQLSRKLHNVLEMMGLQSDDYQVSERNFPVDKLDEIRKNVEEARWEILDRYSDEDFLELLKERVWVNSDTDERESDVEVDLSHSRMILYRYIYHKRPNLAGAYSKTNFWADWKERIEKP